MKNLVLVARILISISFLFSAYTKWIAPGFFELTMISQGVFDDREVAALFARFIIGLEVAIGIGFLQPYWIKKLIAPGTILLLFIFSAQLLYLIATGNDENCGCFGEMIKMTPTESVLKNVVFIGLTIFVYLKSEVNMNKLIIPLSILVVSILGSYVMLPIQKDDGTFTFAKFTKFEGHGVVDLAEGEYLVGVFNTNCDHCQETATKLGKLTNNNIPKLFALFYNEIPEVGPKEFGEKTSTDYPYVIIGDDDFWGLLKSSPPIIYHVKDGEIIKYYEGDEIAEEINAQFQ